jgi:hypothetical protein
MLKFGVQARRLTNRPELSPEIGGNGSHCMESTHARQSSLLVAQYSTDVSLNQSAVESVFIEVLRAAARTAVGALNDALEGST